MTSDARRRAWAALELGPLWISRAAPETAALPDREREAFPAPGAAVSPDAEWQRLREEVADCRLCRLCETRDRTVFGSGSRNARWMLIGEAPGADEDRSGEPFVGQAGRLLDQMLAAAGLDRRNDTFVSNVLKCRPPGNRNPEPFEVESCSGYLRRQIGLLRPGLILLLGRFAAQAVLETDATIGSLRGSVHRYDAGGLDIPVICTYHPAYLLRNLPDKRKSWEDLCLAVSQSPTAATSPAGGE